MPAGVSAYTALANVTLGSSASSVTFSSISQAYRDLVLVSSVTTSANTYTFLRVNGDSGSTNYQGVTAGGNGSSPYSPLTSTNAALINVNFPTNDTAITSATINLLDYSVTDKQKPFLIRVSRASGGTEMSAFRWVNTSAITEIVFGLLTGTYSAGSTFALYGIQS